jgi:hypothetical protein
MTLRSTQPLTEISTRNLLGGKGWPASKIHNLTAVYVGRLTRKCGSLDVSQPYGPPRRIIAIALPICSWMSVAALFQESESLSCLTSSKIHLLPPPPVGIDVGYRGLLRPGLPDATLWFSGSPLLLRVTWVLGHEMSHEIVSLYWPFSLIFPFVVHSIWVFTYYIVWHHFNLAM